MPGLLSAMEGFCVIGIVIATGYVAARMRIGGPTAQMVLNRFSFFVSSPCLMFAILSKEKIDHQRHDDGDRNCPHIESLGAINNERNKPELG